MLIRSRYFVLLLAVFIPACAPQRPATPLETFQTYIKAIKKKDTTTMKILLSTATLKTHEQEAKAQGVTVDDIVKRDTMLAENQKTVEFRNEKIDGDRASLEFKGSYGGWEKVPFVREDGDWKIDKQGYADQMIEDIDRHNRATDDMFNSATPTPYY